MPKLLVPVALLLLATLLLNSMSTVDSRTLPDSKRNCRHNQKTYGDGDSFDYNCTARCTCEDGHLICVDLCPTIQFPPECKLQRKPNECCAEVICE